jgi:hypothetical protein
VVVRLPTCILSDGYEGPINDKARDVVITEKMLLPEALALLEQQPDFVHQKDKTWIRKPWKDMESSPFTYQNFIVYLLR